MVVTKGLLSHSASPFSHRRTFFCCLGACVFWTVEKYVGPYQYFSLSRNREAEHRSIPVLVPRRSYVGPTGNSETLLLVPVVLLPVPGSTPTGTYFRNKTTGRPIRTPTRRATQKKTTRTSNAFDGIAVYVVQSRDDTSCDNRSFSEIALVVVVAVMIGNSRRALTLYRMAGRNEFGSSNPEFPPCSPFLPD
jgi:hypothetical protein